MSVFDMTDQDLAVFELHWERDYWQPGDKLLAYGIHPLLGVDLEEVVQMINEGVDADDVRLYLLEMVTDLEGEEERRAAWYRGHPIRKWAGRLAHRVSLWAGVPPQDEGV